MIVANIGVESGAASSLRGAREKSPLDVLEKDQGDGQDQSEFGTALAQIINLLGGAEDANLAKPAQAAPDKTGSQSSQTPKTKPDNIAAVAALGSIDTSPLTTPVAVGPGARNASGNGVLGQSADATQGGQNWLSTKSPGVGLGTNSTTGATTFAPAKQTNVDILVAPPAGSSDDVQAAAQASVASNSNAGPSDIATNPYAGPNDVAVNLVAPLPPTPTTGPSQPASDDVELAGVAAKASSAGQPPVDAGNAAATFVPFAEVTINGRSVGLAGSTMEAGAAASRGGTAAVSTNRHAPAGEGTIADATRTVTSVPAPGSKTFTHTGLATMQTALDALAEANDSPLLNPRVQPKANPNTQAGNLLNTSATGATSEEVAGPPSGSEVATVRLPTDADVASQTGHRANLRVELADGQTAQATVRQQDGAISVRIVAPTEQSAHRVASEINGLRQNLDAAGIRLDKAEVAHQQGGRSQRNPREQRPYQQSKEASGKGQPSTFSEVLK